jgi:hypothetical protein
MKKAGGARSEILYPYPDFIRCSLLPTLGGLVMASLVGCHQAEEPRSHEAIVQADFKEILDLQGMSCGEVVKFEAIDRFDYRVECRAGERYRVHVSAEGHIGVEMYQE